MLNNLLRYKIVFHSKPNKQLGDNGAERLTAIILKRNRILVLFSVKAKRVNGKRGDDLIIPVPLGTVIKDETSDRVLADMDEVGQRLKVVEGGRGGSPSTVEGGGEKGKRKMIVMEYKMNTDVGLVGYMFIITLIKLRTCFSNSKLSAW